jgi:hypothetical protein
MTPTPNTSPDRLVQAAGHVLLIVGVAIGLLLAALFGF